MKKCKWAGNVLMTIGFALLIWFGYTQFNQITNQQDALDEAWLLINEENSSSRNSQDLPVQNEIEKNESRNSVSSLNNKVNDYSVESFEVPDEEAFAVLEIDALERSVPVVNGTRDEDLNKGVGHVKNSSLPGRGEQIVLSGHRDTVFRDFGELELGDKFLVHMPYGSFEYEIRSTDIVDENDRTVIREMGEEVLVVTTCYPFHYVNNAPERFVIYAYPVELVSKSTENHSS